jgi:phage terminase large subunit-like protein
VTNPSSPLSPDRATAFRNFCHRFIGLNLEPFQEMLVEEFFGGCREMLVLLPRGNGKTELFAALALFDLLVTPEPAVYVAAASRDQARLAFERARKMAVRHPEVERRVKVRHNELRTRDGFLRVLASDAPKVHGLAPTLALVDELHAHGRGDLYVALKTALGKRDGAQLATISTAGFDRDSILGQLRERALSLPEVERDGFLTTARDRAVGFSMFEWSVPDGADLQDPAIVKAANPASFVTEEFLAAQIASPGLHPLEFARYHGNAWTEAADYWLPPGAWQECASAYRIEDGERVWLGVDIGGERAASAIAYTTEDLRVGVEVFEGDGAVLEVAGRIRDLAVRFEVAEVAFDPWRFQAPALELQQDGLPVVPFPQSNVRMVPASERLYSVVREGKLRHPNDQALNRHVARTIARKTERGWRIDKTKSRDQIDAVVALAMAVDRATNRAEPAEVVGWL